MKSLLIVGLGNPGERYHDTRHNAGFHFVMHLQKRWDFPAFTEHKKTSSLLTSGTINGHKVFLAMPKTFMNDSGLSVRGLMDYYAIPQENITIAHDELDVTIGEWKTSSNRGPAGHNGIISIINHIGSQDFTRIRIGIDGRTSEMRQNMRGSDYVLASFRKDEHIILKETFDAILPTLFA